MMETKTIEHIRGLVTEQDIPEEYVGLVKEIGVDAFLCVCRYFGGTMTYLPKEESLLRNKRDQEIRARFFDGATYRELAKMFDLTDRQIAKIVNGK